MPKDILLNSDDDLLFRDGDFVVGESVTQEVGIILRLNQGELKQDPLLGPNLVQMIKSEATSNEVRTKVKLHLQRDGQNYEEIRKQIHTTTK